MFKGEIRGETFGVKYYVVGAWLMWASNVLGNYNRFIDAASEKSVYVYATWYPGLVFVALSGLAEQSCLGCLTRVLQSNLLVKAAAKSVNGQKAK